MVSIGDNEARDVYGIRTAHEFMPNGERRFRLIDRNGFGYVRTEAGERGGWQSSHAHHSITETYIVQTGWIAAAELTSGGELELKVLREGALWTAPISRAHNIYMPSKSVTHVVKHGRGSAADWVTNADTERLNDLTTRLTEAQIVGLSNDGVAGAR